MIFFFEKRMKIEFFNWLIPTAGSLVKLRFTWLVSVSFHSKKNYQGTLFSSVSTRNSLVSVPDPWRGLFELTVCLSRTLYSPRVLHREHYRESRTPSGVPHLVQRSQDTAKNNWRKPWLCVCWKRTFVHGSLILKSQQNRIELVTRPGRLQMQRTWHNYMTLL